MSNSKPDENSRGTLTALSSIGDGTIVQLWADPTLHALLTTAAGSGVITVGTTVVSGGTTGRVLFDNGGVVGEYAITGTGTTVVMQTSPTFNTSINVAGLILDATDINVSTNAALTVSTNNTNRWQFTAAGNYVALTDNTYDIGATGATRPRTVYVGTSVIAPSFVGALTGNASTVTTNANLTGGVTSVGNVATVVTNANLTGAITSSGNATSLGSFSSANLASALTDESGSGSAVFNTNPTIAKPIMNARNQTAQTYSPAGAGTATLDLSLADQHYITMPAGNITIALSNDTNNQIFYISILQDATGSRTVTWFTTIRWAGGSPPTLTTTASKRDSFIFVRTGAATYDGFIVGQNI